MMGKMLHVLHIHVQDMFISQDIYPRILDMHVLDMGTYMQECPYPGYGG